MIPSNWKPADWDAKPCIVRQLTVVWGLITLQFLIYFWILLPVAYYWLGTEAGFCIWLFYCVLGIALSSNHYKVENTAWFLGISASLIGVISTAYLSREVTKSLISFLRFGRILDGYDPTHDYRYGAPLPILACTFCGVVSTFVLMFAAFLLAVSRTARVAYGAET